MFGKTKPASNSSQSLSVTIKTLRAVLLAGLDVITPGIPSAHDDKTPFHYFSSYADQNKTRDAEFGLATVWNYGVDVVNVGSSANAVAAGADSVANASGQVAVTFSDGRVEYGDMVVDLREDSIGAFGAVDRDLLWISGLYPLAETENNATLIPRCLTSNAAIIRSNAQATILRARPVSAAFLPNSKGNLSPNAQGASLAAVLACSQTYLVEKPGGMTCEGVEAASGTTISSLESYNSNLNCTQTIPYLTYLCISPPAISKNTSFECSLAYSTSLEHPETCDAFKSAYNLDDATFGLLNPSVQCDALTHGETICLEGSMEGNSDKLIGGAPTDTAVGVDVTHVQGCTAFAEVTTPDECLEIISTARISLTMLVDWNAGLDCWGLEMNSTVCVGVPAGVSGGSVSTGTVGTVTATGSGTVTSHSGAASASVTADASSSVEVLTSTSVASTSSPVAESPSPAFPSPVSLPVSPIPPTPVPTTQQEPEPPVIQFIQQAPSTTTTTHQEPEPPVIQFIQQTPSTTTPPPPPPSPVAPSPPTTAVHQDLPSPAPLDEGVTEHIKTKEWNEPAPVRTTTTTMHVKAAAPTKHAEKPEPKQVEKPKTTERVEKPEPTEAATKHVDVPSSKPEPKKEDAPAKPVEKSEEPKKESPTKPVEEPKPKKEDAPAKPVEKPEPKKETPAKPVENPEPKKEAAPAKPVMKPEPKKESPPKEPSPTSKPEPKKEVAPTKPVEKPEPKKETPAKPVEKPEPKKESPPAKPAAEKQGPSPTKPDEVSDSKGHPEIPFNAGNTPGVGAEYVVSWNWFVGPTADCDASITAEEFNTGFYAGAQEIPAYCGKSATFTYKGNSVTVKYAWMTTGGTLYHELSPAAFAQLIGSDAKVEDGMTVQQYQAAINDPGRVRATCSGGHC
ncbi:hypothetical protein HDU98_010006 [Podochytrium sp. JEL0797]|nr:hypothetical protein HDU98_010006 [Podochytrium sp. JEL0797]